MAQIHEAIELSNSQLSVQNDFARSETEHDVHGALSQNDMANDIVRIDDDAALNELSLPPADRGIQAWLFLLAAFMLEALVWGFAWTFGVFQDYYSDHDLFREDSSSLAIVGTAQSGIMYIGMLPMLYSLLKFPNFRKW